MDDRINWRLQCNSCELKYPSAIVSHFGFDRQGTLHFHGVCRFCLKPITMTHTAEEITADIREAHNKWADTHGQEQIDLALWEEELGEDDEH